MILFMPSNTFYPYVFVVDSKKIQLLKSVSHTMVLKKRQVNHIERKQLPGRTKTIEKYFTL